MLADRIRAARLPFVTAVVVAGGSGERFGGDKLMAKLGGLPVLARTLLAFERSDVVGEIVIAAREDRIRDVTALCRQYRISKAANVVPGGETRLLSSYRGCLAASERAGIIAIHDGARPLVTEAVIRDAVWAAQLHLAAAPAVPVRDTVKTARDRIVTGTPERASLFAVQTPQCFQRDIILAALARAAEEGTALTDDTLAVERIGGQIWLSDGSEENIKITTPLDIALAEVILARRDGA